MPYLTPDSIPEGDTCRPLLIPNSSEWLALVSGAISELSKEWNWEQFGSVTPAQAAERMLQMLNNYYDDACGSTNCRRIFRTGIGGIIEYSDDGGETFSEAGEAQGRGAINPREELTDDEKRCLAAANAVNVLYLTYIELNQAFNEDSSIQYGVAAFAALVSFALAAIAFNLADDIFTAIINMGIEGFAIGWGFLEFIGDDDWTVSVTDKLQCTLYSLSTVQPDDTVTFDFRAFVDNLPWYGFQPALVGWLWYMLQIIGEDGLNHAGGTTGIETADCDPCETWSYWIPLDALADSHFMESISPPSNNCNNAWNPTPDGRPKTYGYYGGRAEILSQYVSAIHRVGVRLTFPIPANSHLTYIQWDWRNINITVDIIERTKLNGDVVGTCNATRTASGDWTNETVAWDFGGTGSATSTSLWSIYRIRVDGTGYNPFPAWFGEGITNP